MKSESGNWKFWGPKPVPFQLDNESFYLGSDVANYLKLFRGKLYSAFPKLKTKKTQPGQNREIYVSHVIESSKYCWWQNNFCHQFIGDNISRHQHMFRNKLMRIIINILHMKLLFWIWQIAKKFSPLVALDSKIKLIKLNILPLIEKSQKKRKNQKVHQVRRRQTNSLKESFTHN